MKPAGLPTRASIARGALWVRTETVRVSPPGFCDLRIIVILMRNAQMPNETLMFYLRKIVILMRNAQIPNETLMFLVF